MKYLQNLSIILILALTFVSCGKDPIVEEQEPTAKELLSGTWTVEEVAFSSEFLDEFTGETIYMNGKNNESDLTMELKLDGTAVSTGQLRLRTVATFMGQVIEVPDMDIDFTDSDIWEVDASGNLVFVEDEEVDGMGFGVLEEGRLIFRMDETFGDLMDVPLSGAEMKMDFELILVKS